MCVVNYYGCAWAQLMLWNFCASFPFPAAHTHAQRLQTSQRLSKRETGNMWKHMHNGKRAESQKYMPKDNARVSKGRAVCGKAWQTAARLFWLSIGELLLLAANGCSLPAWPPDCLPVRRLLPVSWQLAACWTLAICLLPFGNIIKTAPGT